MPLFLFASVARSPPSSALLFDQTRPFPHSSPKKPFLPERSAPIAHWLFPETSSPPIQFPCLSPAPSPMLSVPEKSQGTTRGSISAQVLRGLPDRLLPAFPEAAHICASLPNCRGDHAATAPFSDPVRQANGDPNTSRNSTIGNSSEF